MAALPPSMYEIMANKGKNYECYKKGDKYGFVVKEYMRADGVQMAIIVYRNPAGFLTSEHVKMDKLEHVSREMCSHIPTDRISMYANGGGRRRTHRQRRRQAQRRRTYRRK